MSTEQEKKRARLHELLVNGAPAVAADGYDLEDLAERLLASGVDVTLPPEPQWKPGQAAHVRFGHNSTPNLAERSHKDGWWVVGSGEHFTDYAVTDVEPVAVLTAEDVRADAERVAKYVAKAVPGGGYAGQLAAEEIVTIFAERGVNVDD